MLCEEKSVFEEMGFTLALAVTETLVLMRLGVYSYYYSEIDRKWCDKVSLENCVVGMRGSGRLG